MPKLRPAPVSPRGQRIDAGRRSLDISWPDLAERAGISRQFMYAYIDGTKDSPGLGIKLAKVLHCSPEWLLQGTGRAPTWAHLVDAGAADDAPAPPIPSRNVAASVAESLALASRELSKLPVAQRNETLAEIQHVLGAKHPAFALTLPELAILLHCGAGHLPDQG